MGIYERGDGELFRFDDPADRLRGHEGFDRVGGEGAEILGDGSVGGEGEQVYRCERHAVVDYRPDAAVIRCVPSK